jgi:hypothetical protein
MSSTISFTSGRPNRNPLRIVTVMALSLALVGGFLLDVARQAGGPAQGAAEVRT